MNAQILPTAARLEGEARVVVRRETLEDLTVRDVR